MLTRCLERAHPFNAAMKKIRYGEISGSRRSREMGRSHTRHTSALLKVKLKTKHFPQHSSLICPGSVWSSQPVTFTPLSLDHRVVTPSHLRFSCIQWSSCYLFGFSKLCCHEHSFWKTSFCSLGVIGWFTWGNARNMCWGTRGVKLDVVYDNMYYTVIIHDTGMHSISLIFFTNIFIDFFFFIPPIN